MIGAGTDVSTTLEPNKRPNCPYCTTCLWVRCRKEKIYFNHSWSSNVAAFRSAVQHILSQLCQTHSVQQVGKPLPRHRCLPHKWPPLEKHPFPRPLIAQINASTCLWYNYHSVLYIMNILCSVLHVKCTYLDGPVPWNQNFSCSWTSVRWRGEAKCKRTSGTHVWFFEHAYPIRSRYLYLWVRFWLENLTNDQCIQRT